MSLVTLLLLLAILALPWLLNWAASQAGRPPLTRSQRWLLLLGGSLGLVLFYGFEGGQWMGLRHLLEQLGAELVITGLGAALLFGSGGRRPGPDTYYPERSGRRAPT